MMRLRLAVGLGLCALACGSSDGAASGSGPVKDPATGLTVATCGMPHYQLLPRSDVGKLLDQDATPKTWASADLVALAKLAKVKLDPPPHGAKLYRYRYTTQDKGQVVEVTGELAFPDGGSALPPNPTTLLWLHGTSGWSDPCSPGNDASFLALTALVASHGYVVVAPDFIGMNSFGAPSSEHAPWLVAEPTALAAWDAMAPAAELLKQVGGGLALSDQVVIAGASQGGHATLFAERFAPYYAPEYHVIAQAAVVPASSIIQLMTNVVSPTASKTEIGIVPPIFETYRDWYGAPKDLHGVYTDTDPHHFASRAEDIVYGGDCNAKVEFTQVSSPSDVFEQSFIDAASADISKLSPWGCYAKENSIITTSNRPKLTSTPTLFVVGEKDEILPGMEPDVAKLCALGLSVEHRSCAGATHLNAALWSVPEVFSWLDDRIAGKPLDASKTCKLAAPACCAGDPSCP